MRVRGRFPSPTWPLVQALLESAARGKTFELYSDSTLPAYTDWPQEFAALASDSATR